MKLITCQHEWVEQCQLRYKVEPPVGYHFEDAHYPEPECREGVETVRLWYPDHIVQGALQTLNLQHPCMHGCRVHVEREILLRVYPEYAELYEEAYSFCQSFAAKRLNKVLHAERDEFGRSIFAMSSLANTYQGEKDERGIPVQRVKNGKRLHQEKDECGRSVRAMRNLRKATEKSHAEKDESGRSKNAVRNGKKAHEEKDECGRSVHAVNLSKGTNSQVWESTVDGFQGKPNSVAFHNRRNGWDPKARIRIS